MARLGPTLAAGSVDGYPEKYGAHHDAMEDQWRVTRRLMRGAVCRARRRHAPLVSGTRQCSAVPHREMSLSSTANRPISRTL
jgi:hypothetical protein